MALRDQPYLPLYVQDFLTDEKLIECSAAATGVYIRLMCIMHKSEQYGVILLRQKDQQTGNNLRDFATKLGRSMPYGLETIEAGLSELILEKVIIYSAENLSITQPRMVKDANLSQIRKDAANTSKRASKKKTFADDFAPAKGQANAAANPAANSENENAIESENESDNESELHSFVKSENLFLGAVPEDLRQLAERLQPADNAGDWQKYVHAQVANLGYKVRREVPCKYADGNDGRIDLVAQKGDLEIAIELDNRVPRKNSIAKIKQNYSIGIVLLRDPKFLKVAVASNPEPNRRLKKHSRVEVQEGIFNDELHVADMQMAFRGKTLEFFQQAFQECYNHHSVAPNPPVEIWEWKQKLNTWLSVKGDGANVKVKQPSKKKVSYNQVK